MYETDKIISKFFLQIKWSLIKELQKLVNSFYGFFAEQLYPKTNLSPSKHLSIASSFQIKRFFKKKKWTPDGAQLWLFFWVL